MLGVVPVTVVLVQVVDSEKTTVRVQNPPGLWGVSHGHQPLASDSHGPDLCHSISSELLCAQARRLIFCEIAATS